MSRVQYNAKEKLAIIEEIDSGELSVMAVAYKYGISKTTLVKCDASMKSMVLKD
ncbi:hypothetical protein [Paenibacillus sp. Soil522]|uniref:hypothetical protein n=1 Tax=Paenibacillus sp. Soil522 TaxID=1736388 RepID=UPI0009D703AE|nr:hypothetical protein [Paenibacillus sp. Soil522]